MSEYKNQRQLADENPKGLETLSNPHNFSCNPGFMSTAGMLRAASPANGDGNIRGTSARGAVRPVGPSPPVSGPIRFNGP